MHGRTVTQKVTHLCELFTIAAVFGPIIRNGRVQVELSALDEL